MPSPASLDGVAPLANSYHPLAVLGFGISGRSCTGRAHKQHDLPGRGEVAHTQDCVHSLVRNDPRSASSSPGYWIRALWIAYLVMSALLFIDILSRIRRRYVLTVLTLRNKRAATCDTDSPVASLQKI